MLRGIVVATAAAFLTASGAVAAELATWDQKRVTEYAGELATASTALKLAIEDVPEPNISQANARYKVEDTVKNLENAAMSLSAALRDGKGREETLPRFKRVETLRRDAEIEARSSDIPEQVFEKVFDVGSALLKLRPYYFAEGDKQGEGVQ
jgi:hypothetical protein